MKEIKMLEQEQLKQDLPEFRPGDTVRVHYRIEEGGKKRIQRFEGTVIKRSINTGRKREINETREERRELLNLIKENIKKYKGRTQREALWAIIHGEMALGTSVEEIKSFVINSGVPLDREIKDYFGIDDEESQD